MPPLSLDEAISLFAERARAIRPGFVLDGSRPVVEAICSRVDNLPLAIELAAARTRVLSVEQILTRLDRRLSLLTTGAADAPERQRTLRATIEWSCELLSEDERALFARLAVFSGGGTLDAVERMPARRSRRVRVADRQESRSRGRGPGRRAAVRDARDDPRARARAARRYAGRG